MYKKPKHSIKKQINEFSKVAGYEISRYINQKFIYILTMTYPGGKNSHLQ